MIIICVSSFWSMKQYLTPPEFPPLFVLVQSGFEKKGKKNFHLSVFLLSVECSVVLISLWITKSDVNVMY